uniref:protein-serine/threonine phosphatase n=1 Tax=Mesocestoides corti TaxID=53468 RepID=A0A5K3F6M3_MESCO
MGAYLSRPKTDKESSSCSNEWISYGCSSMQGWRRFQEDAHNCILDFDPKRTASFFAVYDGHGGSEVAKYCSLHLPEFIRSRPEYSAENVAINPSGILKNAFVDFDVTLTQSKAKSELKLIANPDADDSPKADTSSDEENFRQANNNMSSDSQYKLGEDDPLSVQESVEEISALHEEATRPLEAVLRKQCGGEIPEFIQTLLSSLRPKPGDASGSGPSTSSSSSKPVDDTNDDTGAPHAKDKDSDDAKAEASVPLESQSDRPEEATGASADADGDKTGKEENEEADDEIPVVVDEVEGDDEDDDDEDFEVDDAEVEEEEFGDEEDNSDGENEDDDDDDTDEVDDEDDDDDDEEGCSVGVLPRPVGFSEPGVDSGTTACVALVLPELDEETGQQRVCLYVANAGDSRAVLCRAGAAVELSEDHKPEDDLEKARIYAAGGTVTADGRVNDGLNLSRAIGDHIYKRRTDLKMADQMITALPDVTRSELMPGADEFLVIACDGIWNSMTSQAVVDFVYDRLHPDSAEAGEHGDKMDEGKQKQEGEKAAAAAEKKKEEEVDKASPAFLAKICEELFDACLASNTMGDGTGCDNMTCIIVRFDNLTGLAKCAVTRTVEAEKEEVTEKLSDSNLDPAAPATNGNDAVTGDKMPLSPVTKKARTEGEATVGSTEVPVNGIVAASE